MGWIGRLAFAIGRGARSHPFVVLSSVGGVCGAATIQHLGVLGIGLSPRLFVVPAGVGMVFGLLLATVLQLLATERAQLRIIEDREREIVDLNRTLEQRVALRGEELRLKEAQLQQAQRMEALGRLAGSVAHDFNNLLTAIISWSHFLLEDLGESHPAREAASEVQKASQRAVELTRQLLSFSRRTVLRPHVLDLNAVVEGMVPMLRTVVGEKVRIETELGARCNVRIDRTQLEQVLLNLVVNSRDALPGGGTVVVRTCCTAEPPEISLVVRDDGTGMTPDVKARAFEPLFTTKGDGKGTGLGLAIVKSVSDFSGGRVDSVSEPGRGTTVTLHWPRTEESPMPAPPPRPAAPRGSERVLVVEDEPSVAGLVRVALERVGYQVLEARGAEEARRIFAETGVDLLLADVNIPGLDGPVLAAELARLRPLRVLFMTGYAGEAMTRLSDLWPRAPLVHKPFDPLDLQGRVREALDGPPQEPVPGARG